MGTSLRSGDRVTQVAAPTRFVMHATLGSGRAAARGAYRLGHPAT